MGKVNKEKTIVRRQLRKTKTLLKIQGKYQYPLNMVPEKCIQYMINNIQDIKFNAFEFAKDAKGNELQYIMLYLFNYYSYYEIMNLKPKVFYKFITKI